jgi:predicted fused transcriptional regulator/phosphomethylpyrimidine kinase
MSFDYEGKLWLNLIHGEWNRPSRVEFGQSKHTVTLIQDIFAANKKSKFRIFLLNGCGQNQDLGK